MFSLNYRFLKYNYLNVLFIFIIDKLDWLLYISTFKIMILFVTPIVTISKLLITLQINKFLITTSLAWIIKAG